MPRSVQDEHKKKRIEEYETAFESLLAKIPDEQLRPFIRKIVKKRDRTYDNAASVMNEYSDAVNTLLHTLMSERKVYLQECKRLKTECERLKTEISNAEKRD